SPLKLLTFSRPVQPVQAIIPKATEAAFPFVVLPHDGKSVNGYRTINPTLAEAIESAQSGDTIEISGNGPFPLFRIKLKTKALTLRAGPGFRPLFLRDAGENPLVPLFETEAPLVLEGLEIKIPDSGPGQQARIIKTSSAIHAANCRFRMTYGS